MLNTLAIIRAEILFDLAAARLAFLVQRNADLAIGRGHGAAGQPGILALDVEKPDFAEVEDALVEFGPMIHPAAVNIVRQVIDQPEPRAHRIAVHAGQIVEINVIDRQLVVPRLIGIAVDQIDDRTADAPDRGQPQLHWRRGRLDRLGPARQRLVIGSARIVDTKPHAASRRAMFGREIGGGRLRLVIGDQIDPALPPQINVFRPVPRDMGKSHCGKYRLKQPPFGRGKFDELEPVEAEGVFEQVGHGALRLRNGI